MMGIQIPLQSALELVLAGNQVFAAGYKKSPTWIDNNLLMIVEEGVLSLRIDGNPVTIQAGEYVIIPPQTVHEGDRPQAEVCQIFWLHFLCDGSKNASTSVTLPTQGQIQQPGVIADLLRLLITFQGKGDFSSLSCCSLLQTILAELTRNPSVYTRPQAEHVAMVAMQYILQHTSEDIGTYEIAAALHCHPDHLGRVFKRCYGCSITAVLHRQRMILAKELLFLNDRPIAQLAADCGFTDPAYFSRLFKRYEGCTPRAYRQAHSRARVLIERRVDWRSDVYDSPE